MNKTRVWIAVALATAGTLSVTFALTTGKAADATTAARTDSRSEEHTSELQSQSNLVCRLLLEKKKKKRSEPRRRPGVCSGDVVQQVVPSATCTGRPAHCATLAARVSRALRTDIRPSPRYACVP